MKAEILAVGTEILMGQTVNTNAQYISNILTELGIGVYYHGVVGDNTERLRECLTISLTRADIVIMTGGLGPTQDDLTKETVANVVNKKLILNEEILNKMKLFFKKIEKTMTQNNRKQAYFPEDSIIIHNTKGTAPGCIIENEGKVIIMLPGPPSEMKPMFEETVIPYLSKKNEFKIVSKFVKVFGIGESILEDMLLDLIDKQSNPTIATYAKQGEVTVRVTSKSTSNEKSLELIMPVINEIHKRLGNAVYSTENKRLDEAVGELLIKKNITISIAESCTGGLISSKLSNIPGISQVFNRAIISYSNASKMENLGVKPETIEKYGVVSKETAIEMAKGIRDVSKTDIGVSITGIAGPGGGTEEKPVGLVYISLSSKDNVQYKELRLFGDRSRIMNVASLHVFDMIRLFLT